MNYEEALDNYWAKKLERAYENNDYETILKLLDYLDELDRRLADKKKWDELFKIHGGVVFIPRKEPVYDY
ncbi:hypothetical protein MmarC5_0638 [Methanococcus maripaludis C5]|uniref:Uncharacterized protein n=1 Tax=Methanococcus maripaludis (strain C5 / ATCC BAA-1333) TaxID=402880 RepID=A4FXL6_METM5|nr:hypothetical protein [Methanococcus maripaludis]ABO34950.1 hypothetical protein MmarC5_0638 [Methanococcus maripaludis C5]